MTLRKRKTTSDVVFETSDETREVTPEWLPEALEFARVWREEGWHKQIEPHVRVPQARAGVYAGPDFILLLLVYAASGLRTLKLLFEHLTPTFRALLTRLWRRDKSPSRSQLSRWLKIVNAPVLEAVRRFLFSLLLTQGFRGKHQGGLHDRCGRCWLLFDLDGTRQPARQRALVESPDHPPAIRRRQAFAPGYSGRKRADVQRTRCVLQQSHTSEWLGTWGQPGNGDHWQSLDQAAAAVVAYLDAHDLPASTAIVRLDGQYGYLRAVQILSAHGLGCLMRCCHYQLIERLQLQERLASLMAESFSLPESHVVRAVYDVGVITWACHDDPSQSVDVRLIVTTRPWSGHGKPKIGVPRGDRVFELFVAPAQSEGLSGSDIVSLYLARGGFEGSLAHEDRESDPDRFCSHNPLGQELWQLLAQHVWNLRLWRAAQTHPEQASTRRTLWAAARAPVSLCEGSRLLRLKGLSAFGAAAQACCPWDKQPLESRVALRPSGPMQGQPQRFPAADFELLSPKRVKCPEGHVLKRHGRLKTAQGAKIVFRAQAKDCSRCSARGRCLARGAGRSTARHVTFFETTPSAAALVECPASPADPCTTRPSTGSRALLLDDLPARAMRSSWIERWRRQALQIGPPPPEAPAVRSSPRIFTRAQRARRRLTWRERLARNACRPLTAPWRVTLFQLPQPRAS